MYQAISNGLATVGIAVSPENLRKQVAALLKQIVTLIQQQEPSLQQQLIDELEVLTGWKFEEIIIELTQGLIERPATSPSDTAHFGHTAVLPLVAMLSQQPVGVLPSSGVPTQVTLNLWTSVAPILTALLSSSGQISPTALPWSSRRDTSFFSGSSG